MSRPDRSERRVSSGESNRAHIGIAILILALPADNPSQDPANSSETVPAITGCILLFEGQQSCPSPAPLLLLRAENRGDR
jgi:hypothetical protein